MSKALRAMSKALRATFWNVMELGDKEKQSRTRREYVFRHLFREQWDVIGLIAVCNSARPALDESANQHGYEVIGPRLTPDIASRPKEACTVMLVSRDRAVLNADAAHLVEQRMIWDGDSLHARRDQLLLTAAGVTIDFDGTSLAVACVYTPLHREIELYRPTPLVDDPSSIGKRRRYTPQEAGYERDVSTDTAVAWANDLQHASAADGLIVGGDWNALSERMLQDYRPDIERSGRDSTGRAWRQLLQERPDPVPTYSYGDRVNRGYRFIDQVYTRLPEGLDARLDVTPPPAIDKSEVRMGFASDHAQLRVEVAATRTQPNAGSAVQMAGACA